MEDDRRTYTLDEALIALGFGKFQVYVLLYAGMGWIAEAMEMMLLSFVGSAVQSVWGLSSHEESLITSVVFAGMLIGAYSWGIVSDIYGRRLGWRWLLGVSAIPSSVLLLFYSLTPESPRYLCMRGRKSEALAILEKIASVNGRKLPSGVLVCDDDNSNIELAEEEKFNLLEDAKLISPREVEDINHNASPKSRSGISLLMMLLSPELIRSTLLLWVVFFGNAFTYYGLVLLTTELNSGNHNTCIHKEFQSNNHQDVSYRDIFITSFAEFPGLVLSAAIVDKLGRKKSMTAMFFLCFVILLPLIFHQPQSITTGLLFGARICITGTFTIVYIYAPEIYPTSVRTTGVGAASSVGRIGGMVCPLVAVGLIHGCHQTVAIFLFEAVLFLSGLCVWLLPFETSGTELSNTISSSNP